MASLDIRFHGICTHLYTFDDPQVPHRVVLLQCDEHRPLLAVPQDATISKTGDASCNCIEERTGTEGDRIFQLHGVHLSLPGNPNGELHWRDHWQCGVPKLKRMYPPLGPASEAKVKSETPEGVSAWFDVAYGSLEPYISRKGAVAVRLEVDFAENQPKITARCWQCKDVTWTFELPYRPLEPPLVRISNDCGIAGNASDFLMHYGIVGTMPVGVKTLDRLPDCLIKPDWADWPPPQQPAYDPGLGNASLGCSNSGYP